jgi:hypothetical protein
MEDVRSVTESLTIIPDIMKSELQRTTFLRISGIYDQTQIPFPRCLLDADLELSRISAMKFIEPGLASERNCCRKMLAVFSTPSSNSEFPMRKSSDSPAVITHRQSTKQYPQKDGSVENGFTSIMQQNGMPARSTPL